MKLSTKPDTKLSFSDVGTNENKRNKNNTTRPGFWAKSLSIRTNHEFVNGNRKNCRPQPSNHPTTPPRQPLLRCVHHPSSSTHNFCIVSFAEKLSDNTHPNNVRRIWNVNQIMQHALMLSLISHDENRNHKLTQKHMTFSAWQSPISNHDDQTRIWKLRSRTISIVASKTMCNNKTLHCHDHPTHAVQIHSETHVTYCNGHRMNRQKRLLTTTRKIDRSSKKIPRTLWLT